MERHFHLNQKLSLNKSTIKYTFVVHILFKDHYDRMKYVAFHVYKSFMTFCLLLNLSFLHFPLITQVCKMALLIYFCIILGLSNVFLHAGYEIAEFYYLAQRYRNIILTEPTLKFHFIFATYFKISIFFATHIT